jgi:mannosyltransferase OCH1-like enzyme
LAAVLIPKHVHRIWLGPHPMPGPYIEYGQSWERHGWTVYDWRDDNLPEIINRDVWDAIGNGVNVGGGIPDLGVYVQRADLLQWELVYRYGGVYANTDIELLRPLDTLLADVTCFAAREDATFLGSAIVGATAGHPLFKAIIDELPDRYRRLAGHAMNEQTGPHLLTDVATTRNWPTLTIFPAGLFYPWHYSRPEDEHRPTEAYTNHHWGHTKPGLVGGPVDG